MRFLTVLLCIYCVSAKLPHYIKPCARNDPNFNACAVQHANENIKELVKGDLKNDIPVLDPLFIPEVNIEVNGFNLNIKNIQMKGFKDTTVVSIDYDFKNLKYNMNFKWPIMEFVSNYEVSGKLLLLPINGKGKLNCTLVESETDFNGTLSIETINGKTYLHANEPKARFDSKRLYLKFSNLFNGNKVLEDQVNLFLDENWRDVLDELNKPGTDASLKILLEIVNKINRIAPFEEMFPETLP